MKLYDYIGKKVKIIDNENIEYIGFVYGYTKALDNEENEASIDVVPTKESNSGMGFFESDIKSIEIIK